VETAFSGKAPRWNKEKISALIRLTTEKSTLIKRKFTPSLTSNDTYISRKSQVVGKLRCRIAQVPLYKVNYMMPDVGQRAPKKKVDGLEFCKNHQ
jgi:uncharacterized protein (UPF0303 family)